MSTVQQLVIKVRRSKLCRHAQGTRHCGNPRCRWYIGKVST